MNKNPLLMAFFRAGLFWYVVLTLFATSTKPLGFYHGVFDALPNLLNGLVKAFLGGIMGAFIYLIIYFSRKIDVHHLLLPHEDKLLSFSLGKITRSRSFKETGKASFPTDLIDWFQQYQESYPECGRLFERMVRIIQAYPNIPASPVAGGHGDLSLEVHSWNTLRLSLEYQNKWKYTGMKNRLGEVVVPVKDPNFEFFPDPLIPLIAFCHDIGKIVCYQLADGKVNEVKPNHDEEGVKIVASAPEFRDFSFPDQEVLIVSLGYYHHSRSIPLHVGDRALALTEFVLMIDKLAGKAEGREVADVDPPLFDPSVSEKQTVEFVEHLESIVEPEDSPEKTKTPKKSPKKNINSQFDNTSFQLALNQTVTQTPLIPSDAPADTTSTDRANPSFGEMSVEIAGFKNPIKRKFSTERCDRAFALFLNVVKEPGRLNVTAGQENIGRKYGSHYFIQEHGLRKLVSQSLDAPYQENMARPVEGKSLHDFTLALLWALFDRNMLVREYKNENAEICFVSPNNALFHIRWRDKSGALIRKPGCIVLTVGTDPFWALIPDSPSSPVIEKPMMGGGHVIKLKEVLAA